MTMFNWVFCWLFDIVQPFDVCMFEVVEGSAAAASKSDAPPNSPSPVFIPKPFSCRRLRIHAIAHESSSSGVIPASSRHLCGSEEPTGSGTSQGKLDDKGRSGPLWAQRDLWRCGVAWELRRVWCSICRRCRFG